MIRHLWSVLCLRCITDQDTNSLSLIEVLEEITLTGPLLGEGQTATSPFPIYLVSLWMRDPEDQPVDGAARLQFLSPLGDVIRSFEHPVELLEKPRLRTRANIANLPFSQSGTYSFRLQVREQETEEWRTVATLPLWVKVESPDSST